MIKDSNEYPWSDELQCKYHSWTATNLTTLMLRTPDEDNVCDMAGCIRVAKQLLPDVSKIIVFEGGRLGCVYSRKGIRWTSGREL